MFGIVNQVRAGKRLPPLNTVHADLYSIYSSSKTYASAFHDIKTGFIINNGSGPPVYNAVRGYDMASGIGTPRADNLIELLGKWKETTVLPLSASAFSFDVMSSSVVGVSASSMAINGRIGSSLATFSFTPLAITVGAGFELPVVAAQPGLRPSPSAQDDLQAQVKSAYRSPAADELNLGTKISKRRESEVIDEVLSEYELESRLCEVMATLAS